jgi:hypothetical protein
MSQQKTDPDRSKCSSRDTIPRPEVRVRSLSGMDGIAARHTTPQASIHAVAPTSADIRKAWRSATRARAVTACKECKKARYVILYLNVACRSQSHFDPRPVPLVGLSAATSGHARVVSSSASTAPAAAQSRRPPVPLPVPKPSSPSAPLLPISPSTSSAGRQDRLCSYYLRLLPPAFIRPHATYLPAHLSVHA